MKDEYLDAVRAAGFEGVEVLEERMFPVGFSPDDPTSIGIIKDPSLPAEELSRTAASVVSVSVRARKPLRLSSSPGRGYLEYHFLIT